MALSTPPVLTSDQALHFTALVNEFLNYNTSKSNTNKTAVK